MSKGDPFNGFPFYLKIGGNILGKSFLTFISIILVAVHLVILYFWLFDWEKLVTEIGLISWIGSIFFGVIVYLVFRKKAIIERGLIVSKRLVLATTITTILLGVSAIIIEFITSSMP